MSTNIGNHTSGYPLHGTHQRLSGSGTVARLSAFGRVTVYGKSGDVVYVTTDGLSPGVCQYQAILVQAIGGGVQADVTLMEPDVAMDPTNQTPSPWVVDTTVAAGTLKTLTASTATAVRLTFAAAGVACVAFT